MAGFREFVTGEVLTAANVDDFLAKQAVMKFADAAARDTALGTAVAGGNALREGMVAYLDDEDEVQYFDGTAWDAISQPPAGIGSNVVAGESTATFNTSSGTFVDVTSVTATITPTSATAKVLVLFSATSYGESPGAGGTGQFQLLRGATVIWDSGNLTTFSHSAINVLDSPASASATTYKLQARDIGGGTARVVEGRIHVIEVAV